MQHATAAGCCHCFLAHVVLDANGQTLQHSDALAGSPFCINGIGHRQGGTGIMADERVQFRIQLVDSGKAGRGERPACQFPGL